MSADDNRVRVTPVRPLGPAAYPPAAPSESSASPDYIGAEAEAEIHGWINDVADSDPTLSSASPEPRCGHDEHREFYSDAVRFGHRLGTNPDGSFAHPWEPCPPSADEGMKGSSRHSDGAAPTTERRVGDVLDQMRARGPIVYSLRGAERQYAVDRFWDDYKALDAALHPAVTPADDDYQLWDGDVTSSPAVDAAKALLVAAGYLVHKPDPSSPAIPEGRWVYLHLPDGTPTESGVPDDRAVLEGRVRALLIEQIVAALEEYRGSALALTDTQRAGSAAIERAVEIVRSFATPGDDRGA